MPPTTSSKPFSISLGSKKPPAGASSNIKKRPHSALADDSDSEKEERSEAQSVSEFDRTAGGAIGSDGPAVAEAKLVIPKQANKDWRQEAGRKKGKNLLPAEELARREGRAIEENGNIVVNEIQQTYGLLITKSAEKDDEGDVVMDGTDTDSELVVAKVTPNMRTADEEALEALLGDKKKESSLVIASAAAADERFTPRVTEGNAFKADVKSRPDQASLADYSAVPIEEFGKALLRGMGWKEGQELGKKKGVVIKPREVKRRPNLLGIGAKEVPEGLEEMGAWGKGAKKGNRIDRSYMPLVMKNSTTGEKLTEEEHKARNDNQKIIIQDDWRERRDQNLVIDESKKSERRRHRSKSPLRKSDRDYGSSKHSSLRKDRSRSPKRSSDRDRDDGRNRRRNTEFNDGRRSDRDREEGHDRRRDPEYDDRRRDRYGDRAEKYRSHETNRLESGPRHRDRKERDDRISGGWGNRHDDYAKSRHRDRSR